MKIIDLGFITEIYEDEEIEKYGYGYLIVDEIDKRVVYDSLNIEAFELPLP